MQADDCQREASAGFNTAHSSRVGAMLFNTANASCVKAGEGIVVHHTTEVSVSQINTAEPRQCPKLASIAGTKQIKALVNSISSECSK